ncbi:MAG: hypothetical protein ABNH00_10895 [Dokdonia sp.]|jgi:hypothetical protein
MKTRTKWSIGLGLILLLSVFLMYNYIYQDHRDIASEAPAFTLEAEALSQAFETDQEKATKLYLNQTIQVAGTLSVIEGMTAMIRPNLFFTLSETPKPSSKPTSGRIRVKGRCIGYDSLLNEIKFDQATIIN